ASPATRPLADLLHFPILIPRGTCVILTPEKLCGMCAFAARVRDGRKRVCARLFLDDGAAPPWGARARLTWAETRHEAKSSSRTENRARRTTLVALALFKASPTSYVKRTIMLRTLVGKSLHRRGRGFYRRLVCNHSAGADVPLCRWTAHGVDCGT